MLYLFLLALLTVLLESLFLKTLVPILLGALGLEIAVILISMAASLAVNHDSLTRLRDENTSILADTLRVLSAAMDILRRSTIVWILVAVLMLLYAPAAMAQYRILGRTIEFFKEGIDIKKGVDAFLNYEPPEQADHTTDKRQEMEDSSLRDASEDNSKTEEDRPEASKAEMNPSATGEKKDDWFSLRPKSEQKLARGLQISESERDIVLELSEEERNEVFFLSGEYQINDWDDQEEINRQVQRKVNDLIKQQRENAFDSEDGAPETLRTEVVQASRDDETATELKKKKEIIAIRNSAYQAYPKCSLAKLISETYNGFGLAYHWQCGNEQTAEYYFAQAIPWLFECLTFEENSEDIIRNLLNNIEQRYNDIAYVCSSDRAEKLYSQKLGEAFGMVVVK